MGYLDAMSPKAGSMIRLLVAIVEREGVKGNNAYESFLQDPVNFLLSAKRMYRV